ncbi:MAG: hypothetical protein E6686_10280 [Lachnospiraceae bacterium]|nr:hypothetical protein [Lachnospiraceae bacterium]MDU3181753.1 hypothetical protein [Lachnospiraceae bacterium]
MKKRRMLLIGIMIVVCLLFGGCGSESSEDKSQEEISNDASTTTEQKKGFGLFEMEYIDRTVCFELYRNKTTDTLYILYSYNRQGGLIEMHDPETGLPLTYERYKEIYQEKPNEN